MGFSGGDRYIDLDGNEFHLEAKTAGIAIWSSDELKRYLYLSREDARRLAEDLMFHSDVEVGQTEC